MSIVNSFKFTKTIFESEKFLTATHNQYRVASVRPYTDKKGVLPEGLNLTLTMSILMCWDLIYCSDLRIAKFCNRKGRNKI